MSARPRGFTPRVRGFTLIELVITITILALGLAGVLAALNQTTARSADPMARAQAVAIAEAYLEEIVARAPSDPDGTEAGETRATFDDVDDYDALAGNGCIATSAACPTLGSCACDQFGDPIDALDGYAVAVSVQGAALGTVGAQVVDVTVTHPGFRDLSVTLTGYRTSY